MATVRLRLFLVLSCLAAPARAQQAWLDPSRVCDQAAARAERDWSVPVGVLAAVGAVESGRASVAHTGPVAWPWTINADGQGYFFASKAEAVRAVAALLARSARFVDVGCFQVDLAFHGSAFASLEDAFDPETNARVAARILVRGRLGEQDWSGAVARYHSATPALGMEYLQRVRAAFQQARSRVFSILLDDKVVPAYVILLSPQARQVRVLTSADPAPGTLTPPGPARDVLAPRAANAAPEPQIIRLLPPPPRRELEADRR